MPEAPRQDGLAPVLQTFLVQVWASQEWFAKRVLPLSLDQLRWRPRPGAWSIVECLEHLNLTLAYYLPRIEQAIVQTEREPRDRSTSDLVCSKSELDFLQQVEPPVRSAWIAPAILLPFPAVDPDRVADLFPRLRERYAKAVLSASGLDLANNSVVGSIHPSVQSVGGIIRLLAAHDRRHIWQAVQVRQMPAFPAYDSL